MAAVNYKIIEDKIRIFDGKLRILHRNRSSKLLSGNDFLIKEAAKQIASRLDEDITRTFPAVLDLGSRKGYLSKLLENKIGTTSLIKSDISNFMSPDIVLDEEFIPFANESFNLIVSALNLHWVNDLPGCLIQINRCLKKEGLFIGAIFGGETLKELREATKQADMETNDGISPRISPFVEVKDAGTLLQRAGFTIPVADSYKVTVMYKKAQDLMKDLRAMGETNSLVKRKKEFTTKTTIDNISEKYSDLYSDSDGNIPATFEIITLTGWKS